VGGKPGVWFFSLDAANRPAVWTARWIFHLPRMPLYKEVWARTLAENRLPQQLVEWRRRFRLS